MTTRKTVFVATVASILVLAGFGMGVDASNREEGSAEPGRHGEEIHEAHGEGEHVELTEAQRKEIGLTLKNAAAGDIHHELSFMGEVMFNEDTVAHLVPKVSGIVRGVMASLGDDVREGQALATIDSPELADAKTDYLETTTTLGVAKRAYERKKYLRDEQVASEADLLEKQAEYLNAEAAMKSSRRRLQVLGLAHDEIDLLPQATDESFGTYTLRTPLTGTIVAKHITRGEKVGNDSEVFTVADLSSVWVDLRIPVRDLGRVAVGMDVVIESHDGQRAAGVISLIGPAVDEESRSGLARTVLSNPEGVWKPGRFVTGRVRFSSTRMPVVVEADAVQSIEGEDVVFVPAGDGFRSVMVRLGRRGKDRVEIVDGLQPGDLYVSTGAFELKAVKVTSGADPHAGHGH